MFDRPLIAIDIGSSSIKIVELAGKSSRQLSKVRHEVLPPGTMQNGQIQDEDVLLAITKDLLKKEKIMPKTRRAAISLGSSAVLIKKVLIQQDAARGDLGELAYYEAEQHFQHDIADLYIHHCEFPESVVSGAGESALVLVGARREVVEQYISIVRTLGMRVGVIDCDVFATYNMFEHNFGIFDSIVAIVNVGASSTQVCLVLGGEYLYDRDIAIGGDTYTNKIMESLGIDRENAESVKLAASQGSSETPDEVRQVIDEINEQMVSELKVTIEFFFQDSAAPMQSRSVSEFFLCGGGSHTIGLDGKISSFFRIPAQVMNPFQKVSVNERRFRADNLLSQSQLYGVAVGLGLRQLNDIDK